MLESVRISLSFFLSFSYLRDSGAKVDLLTFADVISLRGRSPRLHFSMLLNSVRALNQSGVPSDRSALCPPTSVWAFLEVSSLAPSSLLVPLQRSCRLFSSHDHVARPFHCLYLWLPNFLHRIFYLHFSIIQYFVEPECLFVFSDSDAVLD